jgi:hypothetical protein
VHDSIDGEPLDIDGEPLDALRGPGVDDDIDGEPLDAPHGPGVDDDIDGEPSKLSRCSLWASELIHARA